MRKTNSQIIEYSWHEGHVVDGVFSLFPDEDHKTCVFCNLPAPCSLYYPPVDRVTDAPPEIQRVRVRVCQNHYSMAWRLAKTRIFPLSIEALYDLFVKNNKKSKANRELLPQWKFDHLGSSCVWRGAVVPKPYYDVFQTWFNTEGLMFRDSNTRLTKSMEMRSILVGVPDEHLLTFERYIMEPEAAAVRNASKYLE